MPAADERSGPEATSRPSRQGVDRLNPPRPEVPVSGHQILDPHRTKQGGSDLTGGVVVAHDMVELPQRWL